MTTEEADPMTRPSLSGELTGSDLRAWYWTMAELQPFARSLGVRAAGPKEALTNRIAAHLDGEPAPSEDRPVRSGPQLMGKLSLETEIPVGQRSSSLLREFFEQQIGPEFTFNGHMRSFLKAGGATLGDAVDHWHRTKASPLPAQSVSLEFNAFTRAWHAANPGGTATQCRDAWAKHRSLPVGSRPSL